MDREEYRVRFWEAAKRAYEHYGFRSMRELAAKMHSNPTSLVDMLTYGQLPTRAKVIQFANAIAEPASKWLELAGYGPLENGVGREREIDVEGVHVFLRTTGDGISQETVESIRQFIEERLKKVPGIE